MYNDEPWYAVKCLFSHPGRANPEDGTLYEERITLWRADSWNEAFQKAKDEARAYAAESDCKFLSATSAFHLFDGSLGEGTEVWSAMRESNLTPDFYVKTFSETDRDRIQRGDAS